MHGKNGILKNIILRFDKFSQRVYLHIISCPSYLSWQVPVHKLAKWYDIFWLIFPVFGVIIFVETIESRLRTRYLPK